MCPELKEKKIIKQSPSSTTDSAAGSNFDCCREVLLKTTMVYVNAGSNHKKLARVLFDDGSQRSYITSSLVNSIKSTPVGTEYVRNILFDGTRTKCQILNNHEISICSLDGGGSMSLMLREKAILGGKISRIPKGFWLEELKKKGIEVSDVEKKN